MRKRLIKLLSFGLILLLSFSVISADIYAASSRPVLKYGMTGSQVKTLQVNLKKLGFFSSGTTGYYGDLTVSAVKKFQKKYGIPTTGVVANLTYSKIDALIKKAASKNTRTPAPTKSTSAPNPAKSTPSKPATQPSSTDTQPTGLKRGSAGQEVTDLQNALRLLGYMKVSPTGGYGPITENAVYMLQKYYGLEPNGIADDKTTATIGRLLGRSDNISRGGDTDRGDVGSGGADPGDAGAVSTDQGSVVQNIVEPLYAVYKQWIPGLPQIPFIQGVGKYKGVVIHYTASPGDNARTEADHERKYWYKAFVHEFIDPVEIIQVADPDYKSWGVGESGNDRFINLELCDASNQSDFDISFDKITQRAAEYLYARRLGVTPAKADGTGTLWGHFQVSDYLGYTNHTDPVAYLAKWGKSWDDVVSIVTEKYNALASGQTLEPIDTVGESTDGIESSAGTSSAETTSPSGITTVSPADGDF
ncbi:MAG TPA: peptidoglycan-binding protein [Clostridia bacterium]|nr:peptidoglycan-binding protein [Clostridia bacterium]